MTGQPKPQPKVKYGILKHLVVPFVVGLIATIFLCGLMIYSERDRFDATVYSWYAILIAAMFPICIPLAIWQQKLKERARRKLPFRPWSEPPANPWFDKHPAETFATQDHLNSFAGIGRSKVRDSPAWPD